jgi:CubicO group peptidase (beta-lactamase class C family)
MAQENAAGRIARDARKRPLDFAPGTQFSYSNSAYILLGFIIERAAGMSYADFVRTRILEPLGMTRSGMEHTDELLSDRADGYRLRQGAFPRAWYNGMSRADYLNAHYQLMAPPQGDAGLVTTARDLYRWDQALYTEQLAKKATLDSIFTPGLEDYGYGWFISSGPDGITHEHSGGLPGFACYIMRIPGHHRTIIFLGNLERLGPAVRDLAAIMRGEPVAVPRARNIIVTDSAQNARHIGVYRTATGDSVEVSVDGPQLLAWWREHFRAPFFPESAQDYNISRLNAVAHFRERNGRKELVIEDAAGGVMVQGVRGQIPR